MESIYVGIKNKIDPPESIKSNIFNMTKEERENNNIKNLPVNLLDAVGQLKKSKIMEELLGEHIFKSFIKNKTYEYEQYNLMVHA
jgi:glutamine synthetase